MDNSHPVTRTLYRLTAKGFDPDKASWEQKVCVIVYTTQGTVDSGGFAQWLARPLEGSRDPEDHPTAFEAIGAVDTADAIRKALARSKTAHPSYDDLDDLVCSESSFNLDLLARYITRNAAALA